MLLPRIRSLFPSRPLAPILALGTVVVMLTAVGCTAEDQPNLNNGARSAVSCQYPTSDAGEIARPVDPPRSGDVAATGTATATMQLGGGTVVITMDRSKAPCTVHSFESLVAQKYYDNTKCHRLVDVGIFILQCGDPTGTGTGGPGYTFADELTGKEVYTSGVVAMANRGEDTNGSQFFFVWDDSQLGADYTIFGTIDASSLTVIKQIASQGVDATTGTLPIADASITTVTMG